MKTSTTIGIAICCLAGGLSAGRTLENRMNPRLDPLTFRDEAMAWRHAAQTWQQASERFEREATAAQQLCRQAIDEGAKAQEIARFYSAKCDAMLLDQFHKDNLRVP